MWQSSVWQSSVWDALEDNASQVNLEVTVQGASDVSKYMGVNAVGVETTFDMSDADDAALLSEMDNVQVWQSSVWYVAPLASARQRASRRRHRAILIAHVR